jgi:hypothetical protein
MIYFFIPIDKLTIIETIYFKMKIIKNKSIKSLSFLCISFLNKSHEIANTMFLLILNAP